MDRIIHHKVQQAHSLTEGIRIQREKLNQWLSEPMLALAEKCAQTDMSDGQLESLLQEACADFANCKYLYVMDSEFVQLTRNIHHDGQDDRYKGRDRKGRPYTLNIIGKTEFKLSQAYISHNRKRPSLTAIHTVRDQQGELMGFLGADFDLRELPHTEECYLEPDNWHQMRGDPVIRRGLFAQQRAVSIMDDNLDEALDTIEELVTECGVYHVDIHFSRSRATVWHVDDPFSYHLLTINELTTPDILLAYPQRPYMERAQIPSERIHQVLDMFRQLRFADDNVYLRFASLNIVNAMVCLNFSCDGTHYMRFDEFIEKDIGFWFGEAEHAIAS